MKPTLIILVCLALAYGAISARANNHREAVSRASAIVAADQIGEPTAPLLSSLKSYISKHTGSSIILKLGGSYARAQAAATASTKSQEITGQLYAEGQATCASKADSLVQARCVQAYVSARLKALSITPVSSPPNPSDYTISYRAPEFAFDLATILGGLSILSLVSGFFWALPKKRGY